MKKTNVIQNVFLEYLLREFLLLKSNNKIICLNQDFEKLWEFELANMVTKTQQASGNLVIFNDKKTKYLNIENGSILETSRSFLIDNELIIEVDHPNIIQSKLDDKIQIAKRFRKYLYVSEQIFLQFNDTTIIANSLQSNQVLWEFDLLNHISTEDKIFSNIVPCNNMLYLYAFGRSTQESNRSYCIDINTGKILKTLPSFTGSIKESGGLLYTSHEKSLQILDPETFEVKEIDLVPELTKHGFKRIDYEKWFVEDNHLYFAQNIGDTIAKIGIYDLETMTIIDKVDLAKENGTVGTLKKNGDRLYIHTQDKTLHIYELEGLES